MCQLAPDTVFLSFRVKQEVRIAGQRELGQQQVLTSGLLSFQGPLVLAAK